MILLDNVIFCSVHEWMRKTKGNDQRSFGSNSSQVGKFIGFTGMRAEVTTTVVHKQLRSAQKRDEFSKCFLALKFSSRERRSPGVGPYCPCRGGPPHHHDHLPGWPFCHHHPVTGWPPHHHDHPTGWHPPPPPRPPPGITQSHDHVMDGRGTRPLRWRSVLVENPNYLPLVPVFSRLNKSLLELEKMWKMFGIWEQIGIWSAASLKYAQSRKTTCILVRPHQCTWRRCASFQFDFLVEWSVRFKHSLGTNVIGPAAWADPACE